MTKKLVTVFPGTGYQGGSVVESLLKNGNFKIRALTRNPDKNKDLIEKGVEVVRCDIADSQSEIEKALKGSDTVFLATAHWSYWGKEAEYGKKAVDAAFAVGVKHFIFSGLTPTNIVSNGKIKVPHFDLKYEIEQHARDISKKNPTFITSFVYAPFYFQNFGTYFPIQKDDDGVYSISMPLDPSSKYPLDMGDITDIGPIVVAMISNPNEYSGKVIAFSSESLTGEQIAKTIEKHTGKTIRFKYIPTEVFSKFGFPGAEEISIMFDFYNSYSMFGNIDKSIAPKITKLTTFDEYLIKNPIKLT